MTEGETFVTLTFPRARSRSSPLHSSRLIARVSGASVPVVMDTPLARLDTDHRTNVLKYFASQVSDQVIFLSQPDEVNGPYLNVIRNRVAVSYRIEFEELGDGIGRAQVRKGYFDREEV